MKMLPSFSLQNSTKVKVALCIYFLLGVLLCCADFGSAQESTRVSDQELVRSIDRFYKDIIACNDSQAFSVSVVKDGKVLFSKGYGQTSMDPRKAKPVTSSTKFGIGSLSKAFTALLFAKKVHESKSFDFDTPISKFMPDFRLVDDYRSEHASLRDLLGHRMAIPAYDFPIEHGLSPEITQEQLISNLQYLKTPYSFREKFIYNNYMYLLAGHILERLSGGKSWGDQITDTIFKPLKMSQSGFLNLVSDRSDDIALPRGTKNGTNVDLDRKLLKIGHIAGAAGSIYSSSDDMAKWMMFLLAQNTSLNLPGDLGGNAAWVQKVFEPSITVASIELFKPQSNLLMQEIDYCMGWISGSYGGYRTYSHDGEIVTYTSNIHLFPDMNMGVFIATSGPLQAEFVLDTPLMISSVLLGLPQPWPEDDLCPLLEQENQNDATIQPNNQKPFQCTKATNCDLSDYVGVYTNIVFGNAEIRLKNTKTDDNVVDDDDGDDDLEDAGHLKMIYGRFGWLELTPISRTQFQGEYHGPSWFLNVYRPFTFEFSICDSKHSSCDGRVVESLLAPSEDGGSSNMFYKKYDKLLLLQ